jgi:hypothetical protein
MNNGDLLQLVWEQNNSQLVRDLGEGSPLLKVIHQTFARVFENMLGCCVISFYEALDSNAMEGCLALHGARRFTVNTIQEVQNGTWKRTGQRLRFVAMESATYAVPNEEFSQSDINRFGPFEYSQI